jgi:hypothetical protein
MTGLFPQHQEEPWVEHATCRSIGHDPFFPEVGEDWRQAMSVCVTRCPVRLQCLDYAMRMEDGSNSKTRFGVWGGLTPIKRKKYEKQWRTERAGDAA